jgi:hypothetical protein
MNGAPLNEIDAALLRQREKNAAASLASVTSGPNDEKCGKRGEHNSLGREKPAVSEERATLELPKVYLVDSPRSSLSGIPSGVCASLSSLAPEARQRAVLVSATLTTREGTDAPLTRAIDRSRSAVGVALLGGVLHTEKVREGHAHAHGLLLFADDVGAALFVDTFASEAGGDLVRAPRLVELSGWPPFARTGAVRSGWSRKSLDEDVRDVLAYAAKDGGAPLAFGCFASVSASLPASPRLCRCGCGRSLERKRGDAAAFDGTCRRRLSRASHVSTSTPKRGTAADPDTCTPKRGESTEEEFEFVFEDEPPARSQKARGDPRRTKAKGRIAVRPSEKPKSNRGT